MQYGFVDLWLSFRFLPMMNGLLSADSFVAPQLDTSEVAKSLQWYTDLALEHGVMPNPITLSKSELPTYEAMNALITSGQVAMWTDKLSNKESRMTGDIAPGDELDVGIAPFPLGEHNANLFSIEGYFISNGTRYPQECWEWIKFLTEHPIYSQDTSQTAIPARRSVADQSGYWLRWTETETEALHFMLEHPLAEPRGSAINGLQEAVNAIWRGQPIETALAEAQKTAQEMYVNQMALSPREIVIEYPASSTDEREIITFASFGLDHSIYYDLADAFNTQQSVIRVSVVSPQDAASADCYVGAADVAQQGNALDLQPFVESAAGLNLADFAFVDDFRVQGDLYGLPAYGVATALFYNPALFDAAGLPYPAPGWTLDDFLRAAQALSHGAGEARQYGFASLSGDAAELPLFAALQGVALWSDDGQPRFDTPEAVAAVAWYADLALKHQVAPQSENLPEIIPADMQQRRQLIQSGRVAMWTGLLGLGQAPLSLATGNAGIAPLPGGYARTFPIGLFIARDAANPDACWQWLAFTAANAPFAPELGLPSYRPATQDAAALAPYRPLLDASPLAFATGDDNQQRALLEALAQIYAGSSPQAALAEAQQKAQP